MRSVGSAWWASVGLLLPAVVVAALAHPAVAVAQPEATATATAGSSGGLVPEPRDDDAWSAYHEAFRRLLTGEEAAARAELAGIEASYPGHPAARQAASLLALARHMPPAPPEAVLAAPPVEVSPRERLSRGARAELIIFQTVHGIVAGAELCAALECDGTRAHALSLMGGGLAGVGLSLLGSAGGVTAGQVELLDTGTLWGAWNAIEIGIIAGQDGGEAGFWRTLLIGQGLGLGVGGLLWLPFRPTSGQVAMASTVGVWSTVLTALSLAAADQNMSEAAIFTTLLVAGDLGLAVGGVAARDSDMSRGRTLLIDAGGVLGLLAGALVASGTDSQATAATAALIGTATGLVVATYATRTWDAPPRSVRLTAMPVPGGGFGAMAGGAF